MDVMATAMVWEPAQGFWNFELVEMERNKLRRIVKHDTVISWLILEVHQPSLSSIFLRLFHTEINKWLARETKKTFQFHPRIRLSLWVH
jgi:hypothetical protein